jgi:protease-4
MMTEHRKPLVRILGGIWNGVDATRKVAVNLLFIAIVVALIALAFRSDTPEIAEGSALVVAPKGRLVEQLTARSIQQVVDEARGAAAPETLLKDVLDAITEATNDTRIEALVLDLRSFGGARMTKLQDVAAALEGFKASGKKVVAMADGYTQDGYYLAAHADEVLMHEMGFVMLEGFGRYKMYYKEGIDKLGLDVHVFRVGEYKSYVEPYIRNDMSPEAKEANLEWMGDLWRVYLEEVAAARGMAADRLDDYAQNVSRIMADVDGDTARAALEYGLIDHALTRVEMRQRLIDLVGEDEDSHSYNQVAFTDYLLTVDDDRFGREAKGDTVAVVVARGSILDGSQPAGTIGGDSTGALIRRARNDEDVKAIVLRVDSGGGSAFASEVIRRECEAARADGKPVIASMGSVAASGGYWISTSSDQIWAHPTTITGSIGILGMFPTYQRPLAEHLGIRVDGVSTAPLAGVRPDRELPPEIGETIQRLIDQGYRDFLERVAESRRTTVEEIDPIARGRVWSGADAYDLGLVDHLGGLDDAIAAAAELAELGDDYTVSYIEKELDFRQRMLREMMAEAVDAGGDEVMRPSHLTRALGQLERQIRVLAELNDPNHVYAWSAIETD